MYLTQVDGPATAPAGRRTLETVNAADAIVDALEMAAHEEEKEEEYQRALRTAEAAAAAGGPSKGPRGGLGGGVKKPQKPLANPLLLGLRPAAYVLRCLGNVRANDLEQALLLLPFTDAVRLMRYLAGWLEEEAQVREGGRFWNMEIFIWSYEGVQVNGVACERGRTLLLCGGGEDVARGGEMGAGRATSSCMGVGVMSNQGEVVNDRAAPVYRCGGATLGTWLGKWERRHRWHRKTEGWHVLWHVLCL